MKFESILEKPSVQVAALLSAGVILGGTAKAIIEPMPSGQCHTQLENPITWTECPARRVGSFINEKVFDTVSDFAESGL